MKAKVMDSMQKFSKAMFVPVLILPIAGILIAIGNVFTNPRLIETFGFLDNPITMGFGSILSAALLPVLTNLGVIFCVGIALGLANKKKAEAAFTALLGYLVFLYAMNKFMELRDMLVAPDQLQGSGQALVLGVQVLAMGVFLGIILGVVVALIHNRFIDTTFSNAFQVYGGARFVFIVLIPVLVLAAIILSFIWPIVQQGIDGLGGVIQKTGNFGIFLYGSLERLLIPTGLHHLIYTPFLYTSLGGVAEVGGQVFEGARNIYFAEIADPAVKVLSQSVIWDARGISKMFGLIGACLAMYQTAKPENKTKVKAILIPAVVTSFVAGVTEPIEFSFMFVAPALFVIHSALSGLSMVALNIFGSRAIGPNGFIDFLLYNIPLGTEKTRWPIYLLVGIAFFFIYYFIFRFLIVKFNFKTVGREDNDQETKLYSKKEYNEKKAQVPADGLMASSTSNDEFSQKIVEGLGGAENIKTIDNCYTRLRLKLADPSLVDEGLLKDQTQAKGVISNGENVHVVYGLTVPQVREKLEKYLGRDSGGDE
ncbi:PTS transporter subunit EIIC [Enterococcus dongliensis]|uniref:PTS transporter subunit EIIC n=1 Tax=Enterococcus dongliensis TaxID=2559925 RepID=A0AAW8TJU1_9ENTE|nr:PTS transporter subunit EIIC [Enterococcus dongliensis]MDT2596048.1 PTS transporter subunit EIIC [Enterococcus dongliensis]MDT2603490.1 PTS transporter subunit EIIC [Enterococcus dongliensis]MDT2634385.1 PTS transporter subunit EIIC [Enterococcus dongliensis]MDT2636902.1 PTS transporter subunit EIIC [Enterococcus dongliensis]MDT2642004.1 PTS transporter subunit EIIC [Enterococcus dongliensis]